MPENDRQHIGPLPPGYDDAGAPLDLQDIMRTTYEIRRRREREATTYEDWLNQTTYSPEALRAVNMNQDPHVTAEERRQMMERYRQDMERGAWRFTTQGIYEEIQRVQTTPEEALTTEYRAHRDSIAKKKPDEPDPVDPKDWSPF